MTIRVRTSRKPISTRYFHTPNIPKPVKKGKPKIEKIEFTEEQKENIKRILEGKQRTDAKTTQRTFNSSRGYMIARIRKITGGFCCKCDKFNTHLLKYKMDGIYLIERYCSEHVPTP
jgi:hypothetical protein